LKLIDVRYLAEYAVARALLLLIDLPPLTVATWFARRIAEAWYLIDFPRRRVVRENVLRSGVVGDPRAASALARKSVHHFAAVVVESLRSAPYLGDGRWQEHLQLEIHPEVEDVLNDPSQGLIVTSGHFGNWEIAAHVVSMFKPVVGVTRKMNNPLVERLISERKPRFRFRLEPKHAEDPIHLISVLKRGEALALLTDQHAHPFHGMKVDFFGHPVSSHTSAAMLHLVTRAPLCFAWCRRTGTMSFELKTTGLIRQPPSGTKDADVKAILDRLNRELEQVIREAPEQYLWGHRRWRDLPEWITLPRNERRAARHAANGGKQG